MSAHRCPAPGCERQVPSSQYACRVHWYMIPRPLRTALWRAYERDGALSPAHIAAMQACGRALQRIAGTGPGAA